MHSKTNGEETPEVYATRGGNPRIAVIIRAEADRRAAVRRDQSAVFAMGHPEWLGVG